MASSTVALATEAMAFSVAGSITSKRQLSDDLRHLPPIHRSVGTLARRFSYMTRSFDFLCPLIPAQAGIQIVQGLDTCLHGNERISSPSSAARFPQCGPASAARCLPGYRRPAAGYAA